MAEEFGTCSVWRAGSWGFIRPDGGVKDLFVHFSDIEAEPGRFRELKPGERVRFTRGIGRDGVREAAKSVIRIGNDQEAA